MRSTRFLLATVKQTPADAEIVSHQLMVRAGMIRQVAAGVYNWLPVGYRVLRKVENIVREEMDRAGAQEVLLPAVQPAELWRESGRWDEYGPELFRLADRHQRDFCLGPTHEEIITTLLKGEIRSYRQLPANLYQIQTKFRDEIRPRFGVMRGREFIMKDAYSFDVDPAGMEAAYQIMYHTYECIFQRLGLESRAVRAHGGAIGGSFSHEFHVLADSGEDAIAVCGACEYAANVEMVATPQPAPSDEVKVAPDMETVDTPGAHTIAAVSELLGIGAEQTVKTLLVEGRDGPVALVLRGDHELNAVKTEAIELIRSPLRFASNADIHAATGADPGSVGPLGLDIPVLADHEAAALASFVCGANANDKHLRDVRWGRDLPRPETHDLRKAVAGDPCPECGAALRVRRGIEVGHVFQLGTKYSEAFGATCLDSRGRGVPMHMGCYGIGVTRVIAAAIEQNHDEHGIVWPDPIAPFHVCIVPIGLRKSKLVSDTATMIHEKLEAAGFEVLLDDRDERPGVMFADMDLIGIPHRLVVGERGLAKGIVEYRSRRTGVTRDVPLDDVVETLEWSAPLPKPASLRQTGVSS